MSADKQYQATANAAGWKRNEFNERSAIVAKYIDLRWAVSRIAHFSKYTFFDQRVGAVTPFEIAAIIVVFAIPIIAASGSTAAIMMFLTVLVVLKTNALQLTLGVSWERAILFHKAFGTVSLIVSCIHGIPKISSEILNEDKELSGLLLTLLLGLQPILYLVIKPYFFEAFYYLHLAMYGAMVYFAILHGAYFVLYSVIVFGVDLLIRYVLTARRVKMTAVHKGGSVVQLCFDRPWNFHAGQYVFLMIPALGVYEWHPFSLSSAPHESKAYLHVEVVGGWTQGLAKLAGNTGAPVEINGFMEGPYGVPAVNLEDDTYKIVLLISGSIGVTPHQAIANSLLEAHQQGRPLKKIMYVWALKELKLDIINTMIDANLFPVTRSIALEPVGTTPSTGPDGLHHANTLDGPGVLCTELYCTSGAKAPGARAVTPQDTVEDLEVKDLEGGVDVKETLKYGRPDIVDLFKRVKTLALSQQETRVAVSVCGPAALVESVAAACRATTSKEVQFDIHIETFQM